MKDEINYYEFNNIEKYKNKYKNNILFYILSVIAFILINIILHFIKNDYLYILIITFLWLLFINCSIIFIYNKIIMVKKVINLYNKLDYGNKKNKKLMFLKTNETIKIDDLQYKEFIFVDEVNQEHKVYLYKFIEDAFIKDNWYELTLINDLIYGSKKYE